jgi:hypothetical protein
MRHGFGRRAALLGALLLLAGCGAQGDVGAPVAAPRLERCAEPLGTVAVADGREAAWSAAFTARAEGATIEPLARLVVQRSNCLSVAAVGRASELLGATTGRPPRPVAGMLLEAAVLLPAPAVSNIFSGGWGAVGTGFAVQSAEVSMALASLLTGARVATAEAVATASQFAAVVADLGGDASVVLADFGRSPEGQAAVVAFVEAYNRLVIALRAAPGAGNRLPVMR